MKDLQEVNSKITYSERHLKAVRNEIGKLSNEISPNEIIKNPSSARFTNIHKHLKEIASELYLIREALATFDSTLPEHEDAAIKFKELVLELKAIKQELDGFKNSPTAPQKEKEVPQAKQKTTTEPSTEATVKGKKDTLAEPIKAQKQQTTQKKEVPREIEVEDVESFIGTKVISIVGILLIMLGVGYGAKYAIENNLISPKIWIIAVYFLGTALLLMALKLKSKYENFSAVLLSGAMATYYFTTYFAFAQYGLIAREVAFGMMLIFTVFTVLSALRYDNQIIAHIGFVGAYAVPFLVRENNENVVALFSFMSIVNIGILAVAIKKYWQSLFYSAFFLTWLIFAKWFFSTYTHSVDLNTAITFVSVFFIIFYATILAYKLLHSKVFDGGDISLIILNAVFAYSFGLAILSHSTSTQDYLGLFTLLNGAMHLIVNFTIKRFKEYDKNMHYLTFGLALAFVTIAIPLEFDGSWLALFWLMESAALFWIGRTQKVRFYEIFSYPLLGFAIISLVYGWGEYYGNLHEFKLFLNVDFLISVLFILILGVMLIIARKTKENAFNGYSGVLTGALFTMLYFAFFLEINSYWNAQLGINNELPQWMWISSNAQALETFRLIWLTNYTLLYLIVISWVNIKFYKNQTFASVNLIINACAIFLFLTFGLYNLSLSKEFGDFGTQYLLRYSSIAILGGLLFSTSQYTRQPFVQLNSTIGINIATHIIFLCVLTSELFNWMHLMNTESIYKLGLSLLWSGYGFGMIIYGIWKRAKHLRIMAFILFGLTIFKLFFYDIAHQSTISKTIVMISLGAVLLIVSFLYNKYMENILKEEREIKENIG
jgi:uncharacterized membrane protein